MLNQGVMLPSQSALSERVCKTGFKTYACATLRLGIFTNSANQHKFQSKFVKVLFDLFLYSCL